MASVLSINVVAKTLNRKPLQARSPNRRGVAPKAFWGVSQDDKNKSREAQFQIQQSYLNDRRAGRAIPNALEKRRKRQAMQLQMARQKQEQARGSQEDTFAQILKDQLQRLELRKKVSKSNVIVDAKGLRTLFGGGR